MSFSNSLAILQQIKTQITTALGTSIPGLTIGLDEPVDLVYESLPEICIYPIKEDFVFDESFSQDAKKLALRIELRMPGGPASSVCSAPLNLICDALKGSKLGGLATYTELETIQWASDVTSKGNVCGAAVDLTVHYLI